MVNIKKYYKEIIFAPFGIAVFLHSLNVMQKNYIFYVKKSLFGQDNERLEFLASIKPFKIEDTFVKILGAPGLIFLTVYFFAFLLWVAVDSSRKVFLAKDKSEKNKLFVKFITASGVIFGSWLMIFQRVVCHVDYAPNDCSHPALESILVFWGSLIAFLYILNLESRKNDQN